MADNILEIVGLWLFCDYCLIKNIAKIKKLLLNGFEDMNLYYSGLLDTYSIIDILSTS